MSGMENAVTAIALDVETVVTTSTGVKDAMEGVSGYAVRIWKQGKQVSIQRSHYASIRCCCPYFLYDHLPSSTLLDGPADGFFTGGNDGKLICYRRDGSILFRCETPPNVRRAERRLRIGRREVPVYDESEIDGRFRQHECPICECE